MKTRFLIFISYQAIIRQVLICVLISVFIMDHANAQLQNYPYKIKYLTVDEGLSHTDANDIAQDKQGFIWVATYFGLDRYDGYTIKKYYNSTEPFNNAYNNRLQSIFPDDEGNIWICSEGGLQRFDVRLEKYINYKFSGKILNNLSKLYKPAGNKIFALVGNQFKTFVIHGDRLTEQKSNVLNQMGCTDFVVDQNRNIYLATDKGLWILNSTGKLTRLYLDQPQQQNIIRISFDNDGNLLLATVNSAYIVHQLNLPYSNNNIRLKIVKQFIYANHGPIKNILQDKNSFYWINDGANLLKLDNSFHLLQVINGTNLQQGQGLNSNSLSKIFIDRSQCLWICTFGGGVNYFDLNAKPFYTLQHNPDSANSLSGNYIRSVLEDGHYLWLGTTANGLNRYDFISHNFQHYNTYDSRVRLKSNTITALLLDNDHNLWIGNSGGIEIMKPDGLELFRPKGYEQFPTYILDTFAKDCFGNIWFGNHTNRFGVIWKDQNDYYHVKYYGEGFFILADPKKPQLFVSSTHGLKRLIIDHEGNILSASVYEAALKPGAISSNYTYPIVKENDSTYWIGTIGGGLNRLSLAADGSSFFKTYASKYGIFNDVESLEIDSAGNIWMGGNGLDYFNPRSMKLIRYDKNDGLQGNSFKVASSYKGASGRLYFGGINGLNYFYPEQIHSNKIPAVPVITDLLINNEEPEIGGPDSGKNRIKNSVSFCHRLQINYLQNNFELFFSSMHFANPLKCKYRYKLIGFDQDWKYTDGKNPSAAYNNMDYKQYTFTVQATNNDGIWSLQSAQMQIVIAPPWWKSVTAKVIYVILFLALLIGIYIYQARWYKLKQKIEVQKINEEKREEMHKQREDFFQQQLAFFTNISHEFRTPLTLILGPLENLIHQNRDTSLDRSYQLMLRNTKRLLNLITELMNFKKVADSVIKLQVQPLNIVSFSENLVNEFANIAVSKDIAFKFLNNVSPNNNAEFTGFFDIQVLEKILFNLLNNSFKYTAVNGQIVFEIFLDMNEFRPAYETEFKLLNTNYRTDEYLYFRIADSGIGISLESITRIFDRYYRISKNHLGSGVGLSLVKSLTELHKGNIYVYSERHKGTEIIIGIPWQKKDYSNSEIRKSAKDDEFQLEPIDNSIFTPFPDHPDTVAPLGVQINKHILIVDDNQELRSFLKESFDKQYHIYEAEDGIKGFAVASEKIPDLIISDVMMPGMSGIEFCKLIKDTFETRHIPFIILSAKDALDTKIEGMESGADFYFAKPLSIELLALTVHNIFEQREMLKQRYTQNYLSEATDLVHSEEDKDFFDKLIKIVENNIQNQDLDVDFLCKHLFVSRTKLYQKIKSISDQSVGEFIRTIRLKKSIYIMTHESISMNEVADRVGLQTISNFSRVFKKEYGKSPMQFLQSLKSNVSSE